MPHSYPEPKAKGKSRKQAGATTFVEGSSAHTVLSLPLPLKKNQQHRNGTSGVLCLLSYGTPKRTKTFTLVSLSRLDFFFLLLLSLRDSTWSSIFQQRANSQANTSSRRDIHSRLYPWPSLKVSSVAICIFPGFYLGLMPLEE